jgi:Domain of unknown function (DUF6484)
VAAKKALPRVRTAATQARPATQAERDAAALMQSLLGARPVLQPASGIAGVVIGVLHDFDADGQPRVRVPGRIDVPAVARACCVLSPGQEGSQCALMFEGGELSRPLVMGVLQDPVITLQAEGAVSVVEDGEVFSIEAEHAIELRCGKASLRLTGDGRIELRGTTVVSHATGLNRIRGASIKLN